MTHVRHGDWSVQVLQYFYNEVVDIASHDLYKNLLHFRSKTIRVRRLSICQHP